MLRRFARSENGLAAVEFAFVAPIMVVMFFGAIELSQGVDCRARVTDVAATASDLVAQETTVSTTDMSNVFSALNSIMYPFPPGAMRIVISSLVDDGHGNGKVAWSDQQNSTARSVGSIVTLPAGLITAGSGSSVIMSEVTYSYTSATTVVIGSPISMTYTFYSKPRRGLTVSHT
jgi:Flp pilus assembly protein TadG